MVPHEITVAGIAGCLGVSERRVATVKAEGRLPLTPSGRVDLHELIRRGWAASLATKGHPVVFREPTAEERAGLKALAPAFDFTALLDKGFALATLLALHEAPICAALAAAEVGASRLQTERLADVLLVLLWRAMNRHADAWGLPDPGEDGPIYAEADMLAWREEVNWPGLFGAEGLSVVQGQMAESMAEKDMQEASV
jgi:hypothetical protein